MGKKKGGEAVKFFMTIIKMRNEKIKILMLGRLPSSQHFL